MKIFVKFKTPKNYIYIYINKKIFLYTYICLKTTFMVKTQKKNYFLNIYKNYS